MLLLFRDVDHAERGWDVTIRPHQNTLMVTFLCHTKRGKKVLDQTAFWNPDTSWDMTR